MPLWASPPPVKKPLCRIFRIISGKKANEIARFAHQFYRPVSFEPAFLHSQPAFRVGIRGQYSIHCGTFQQDSRRNPRKHAFPRAHIFNQYAARKNQHERQNKERLKVNTALICTVKAREAHDNARIHQKQRFIRFRPSPPHDSPLIFEKRAAPLRPP